MLRNYTALDKWVRYGRSSRHQRRISQFTTKEHARPDVVSKTSTRKRATSLPRRRTRAVTSRVENKTGYFTPTPQIQTRSHGNRKMVSLDAGLLTALISVVTLTLSRCRCLVRSSEDGLRWGVGFTDRALFEETPAAATARPRE